MLKHRKEQALASFFPDEVVQSGGNYPYVANIPAYIHQRNLQALSGTLSDLVERGINYYYRGRWTDEGISRGSEPVLCENGDVLSEVDRDWVLRPHIRMHTHPVYGASFVRPSVLQKMKFYGWDPEQARREYEGELLYHSVSHHLPSYYDAYGAHGNENGTVGNIISSETGTFLFLRRRLTVIDWPNLSNAESAKARERVMTTRRQIVVDQPEVTEAARLALSAAAGALTEKYVCYVVSDPENPNLERVQ